MGDRVQKSVFECVLTAAQRDRLLARLEPFFDDRTDSIRCYVLCRACAERTIAKPAAAPRATVVVV
jgi:CRISPR-associated protein Cas2